MCELYNKTLKERFLEKYPKTTRSVYEYVLGKAKTTEEFLGKDIYEMDSIELDKLIKNYHNASLNSVYSIVSVLRQYLDFCIDNGYIKINWLNGMSGSHTFKKYISQEILTKKYITKEQLNEIQKLSDNAQDIIVPTLLFEGIKGFCSR